MQACPYDALYIDPYSHTAAKCNYCAHRIEVGIEPACVVVCPERAIIAGDLQNPESEIARVVAREPVRTRKPEQGTGPNVYYLGAEEAAIDPEIAVEELPQMTMWSTLLKPDQHDAIEFDRSKSLRIPKTMNQLKPYTSPDPQRGVSIGAHIVYDTPKNTAPWGWKVSAYLGTKSIGAGVMIVAAFVLVLYGLNGTLSSAMFNLLGIAAPVIGGFFIALTLVLLIADLKKPGRALFLILKPNPTSWLVWGAYILGIFGLIEATWFISALFGLTDVLLWLIIPTLLFGAAGTGYTAFLFGQAEGRDFWQSPLLLPILLVQAVIAGASALGLLSWPLSIARSVSTSLTIILLSAIILHIFLIMIEVFAAHSNNHVATAARFMRSGRIKDIFWGLFLILGSLLPIAMLSITRLVPDAQPALLALAGMLALIGIFVYEHCFVTAGQIVPLS
jgi:formate-dependent nitrite reductase membrane component NrfD